MINSVSQYSAVSKTFFHRIAVTPSAEVLEALIADSTEDLSHAWGRAFAMSVRRLRYGIGVGSLHGAEDHAVRAWFDAVLLEARFLQLEIRRKDCDADYAWEIVGAPYLTGLGCPFVYAQW